MATGHFLRIGDKTTCGGSILSGSPHHSFGGIATARNGDSVSCGKDGKVYHIAGGIPNYMIHGVSAAGTLNSRSTCPCNARFISSFPNASYWLEEAKIVKAAPVAAPLVAAAPTPQHAKVAELEQHAQAAKKKVEAKREPVDAGFCVLPYGVEIGAYEPWLFESEPPAGTRELYRSLNGAGKEYKTGSILLLVDPDKQDDEQIAHMQKAKARVDAALESLTHQEANFLHKNKDTIDLFTSRASMTTGIASEAAGKYFEKIESVLTKIQQAYKNQYITSGSLISEQFYVQRRQLFDELDSILTDFTRHKLALQDYPDIKRALGLSTSSITHRWNQTGVADIEGYATFMENAAKYVKMMKAVGYVGIALDGANRLDKIYEACTVGSDCEKAAFTQVGGFSVGTAAGIYTSSAVYSGATAACSVVLGALTVEVGAVGALACGVIVSGAVGYGVGEVGSNVGEFAGEKIYEVVK